jgi:hypothetical protein
VEERGREGGSATVSNSTHIKELLERLPSEEIRVTFLGETRVTHLYKKKNGTFVYWSPFTGERVQISRTLKPLLRSLADVKAEAPTRRRHGWELDRILKIESMLEKSRRCPERPGRTAR